MPKIFEYLGIVFYFYSNEHEPIHVHARYGEYESKAEFYIVDSKIEEIRISNINVSSTTKQNRHAGKICLNISKRQILSGI